MQHDGPRAKPGPHVGCARRGSGRRTGPARGSTAARGPGRARSRSAPGSPSRSPAGTCRAARTRCRNIVVAAPPSAGTSLPSISGQSVNTSCGVRGAHVRADEQQRERDAGGPRGRPRERAVAAGRPLGGGHRRASDGDDDHVGDQRQRRHEVSRHPPRDRSPSARRCRRGPPARRPAGTRRGPAPARAGPRDRPRQASRAVSPISTIARNATTRCENSMSECIGTRREQAAGLARRPGGASQARAGSAHEPADGEQHDGGDGGGEGELPEPGHGRGAHDRGGRSVRSPWIPAVRPWRFPSAMA